MNDVCACVNAVSRDAAANRSELFVRFVMLLKDSSLVVRFKPNHEIQAWSWAATVHAACVDKCSADVI
jgi:hypothetical protein